MPDYISRLDDLITIQIPTKEEGEYGECINSYGDDKSVWSNVSAISGDAGYEETKNGRRTAYKKLTFEVRYDKDLLNSGHFGVNCVLNYESVDYHAYAIEEKGRNDRLVIFGKAQVN